MDLRDLAGLAAEMYERSRPDRPDEDPAGAFEDRAVRLVRWPRTLTGSVMRL
jgi:hypothetical protein